MALEIDSESKTKSGCSNRLFSKNSPLTVTFHSFISDIGGATGVILGISFATVFGAIDFAFAHFIGKIKLDL